MPKKSAKKELQGMEPFMTKKLPSAKPPDDVIDNILKELLDDLDLYGEKRTPLENNKTPKEKWEFITLQESRDLSTPSPRAFLKNLRKNLSPDLLESLSINLAKYRLSWGQQFFDENGHTFLFNLISQISFKLNLTSEISKNDGLIMSSLLSCIRIFAI
mgnify:FL=1